MAILYDESWKDIESYNGDYQISNFGRIRSFKKTNYVVLKQCKIKSGYFVINLFENKKSKTKYIHKLVYETFKEKLKKNEVIHHVDGNKENNIETNLVKMTDLNHKSFHSKGCNNPLFGKSLHKDHKKKLSENHADVRGENNRMCKLKEGEVWLIKKILNSDYYKSKKINQKFIGKMFNISHFTISKIKTGKLWSHVKIGDING